MGIVSVQEAVRLSSRAVIKIPSSVTDKISQWFNSRIRLAVASLTFVWLMYFLAVGALLRKGNAISVSECLQRGQLIC